MLVTDFWLVLGLSSREGEEVVFLEEISTVDHPKINEWLSLVEKQMRVTLASCLASAVRDIKELSASGNARETLLEWCDRYQAQIAVLAAQILWSEDVEQALATISASSDHNMKPLHDVLASVSFNIQFYSSMVGLGLI